MYFVMDAKYIIKLIQDSNKSVKKYKIFKNEHPYIKLDADTVMYTYYAHLIWTTFGWKYIFVSRESNSLTNFVANHARNLQLND